MQLDADMEKRIRARAEQQGDDPDEAVAEAKRMIEDGAYEMARPPVERLAPFFPFIKVSELRSCWLGLEDALEDDALTCSEFLAKHPPPPISARAPAKPPEAAPPTDDSGPGQRQQKKLTDGSSTETDATATPA